MKSKNIIAGVVASMVVSTAPAIAAPDNAVSEKQAQASIISSIFGNVTQTINSPECTVDPVP